jgi:localization factor PodJL
LTQPVGRVVARAVPEMPPPQRLPSTAPLEMPAPEPAPVAAMPRPAAPPSPAPSAPPQQQTQPAQRRMPQAKLGPINPDLPPDQPLEPGSGPPRQRTGARFAMGEARSAAAATPAAGGASNFIAAARRAAQSAVRASSRPAAPEQAVEPDEGLPDEAPRGLMKRMKSLFVAASIVAIAVGGVQIGGKLLLGSRPAHVVGLSANPPAPQTLAANDTDEDADTMSAAPAGPLAPAPAVSAPASIMTDPRRMIPAMPSPLAAPALSAAPAPAAKNDITGSIPPAPHAAPRATERLPSEIGGPKLRNAALGGNAAAAYEIGLRYAEGHGVPANQEEAARWYERAASKGVALAQFRYAAMLEKGRGVKKDLGQARRLYLAAASKGNAKAMHNLAVLYAEGIDGKPDYATAAQWFRKAAGHGVADSQYNLGVLAARGLGTPKSLAESYKWFALAAAQGDKEAARKRDEVASQMDAGSVAAAQAAVKSFVAAPQPQDAIAVATPPGGWDDAATPAPAGSKARSGATMALGSYKVGTR